MRRRQKKPRIQFPQIPETAAVQQDDDDDESSSFILGPREEETRERRKRNHVQRELDESLNDGCNDDGDDDNDDDDDNDKKEEARIDALVLQNKWSFCCSTCACPPDRKQRAEHLPWVVSSNGRFPHCTCCHGILDQAASAEWASPYETCEHHAAQAALEQIVLHQQANEEMEDEAEDGKPSSAIATNKKEETTYTDFGYEVVDPKEAREKYLSAKNQESKYANLRKADDPAAVPFSNLDYAAASHAFLRRVKEIREGKQQRHGAVVLDLFSGMGSAVVALKRLGIGIQKLIHCERDKVANFVYQEHHNVQSLKGDNNSIEDGAVECVRYQSFEDLAGTDQAYNEFMNAHAPIDIAAAGPPCQDFTPINASRQGLDGPKGSYMMKTARLIHRIQSDPRQAGKPLYYLIENVVLRNNKEKPLAEGVKERIQRALGCTWDAVELDAACVSPCARERSFFTNIRLGSFLRQGQDLFSNPTSVLKDGFRLAANLDVYEPAMLAKVPTFMASNGCINNKRMRVYRQGQPYVSRVIDLSERLQLMGFPPDYLDCVGRLYETLLHHGHEMVGSKHWSETLEPRYHEFQGAFHGISPPIGRGQCAYV